MHEGQNFINTSFLFHTHLLCTSEIICVTSLQGSIVSCAYSQLLIQVVKEIMVFHLGIVESVYFRPQTELLHWGCGLLSVRGSNIEQTQISKQKVLIFISQYLSLHHCSFEFLGAENQILCLQDQLLHQWCNLSHPLWIWSCLPTMLLRALIHQKPM